MVREIGKTIQDQIRRILMEYSDPIGIANVPECADEYDSYIGGVYRLLVDGAADSQIVQYLLHIERAQMGLRSARNRDLANLISALRTLDIGAP